MKKSKKGKEPWKKKQRKMELLSGKKKYKKKMKQKRRKNRQRMFPKKTKGQKKTKGPNFLHETTWIMISDLLLCVFGKICLRPIKPK